MSVSKGAKKVSPPAARKRKGTAAPPPPPKAPKAATRKGRTRHLVIVESPAKAETIARFLGPDYHVDSSYGHVRDLPGSAEERPDWLRGQPWADLAVNVDNDFEPVYIIPADKQRHVERLQRELKQADKLLVATDEDREGESIGWHLVEVLQPLVPVERIVFHEVTPEAIAEAIKAPRALDRDLVAAQESRRILDRLFGYSLSPVLWRKVRAGLSAGRVQSVAVRLLVRRERERAAFRRGEYWDVQAALEAATGRLTATLRRLGSDRMPIGKDFDPATGAVKSPGVRALSEAEARALVPALEAGVWSVTAVQASPATQRPAAPFTTSTLQQEANRKLGFSASRTMQVAQRLYEGVDLADERVGLITYMRTDSVTMAGQALQEAQEVIRDRFGAEFARGPRAYKTRTKNAQEAHEAIRPTHLTRTAEMLRLHLHRDELRLYELIWQRTLASQMPDAQLERTVIEMSVPLDGGPALFDARGRRVVFSGFLQVYVEGSDESESDADAEQALPAVAVSERLRPLDLAVKGHETQPPPRFTDASLVKELEEDGIGRPSTYASILGTVIDRGYAFRMGNALVPTFLAYAVTDLLEQHFGDLVDPGFTAQMEDTLDAIARGETDSVTHLRAFYRGSDEAHGLQRRIEQELPQIAFPQHQVGAGPAGGEAGGEAIVVRIGRFGPYLQRGEGGAGNTVAIPPDLPPADLTLGTALDLLAAKQEGPRNLGRDPENGLDVTLQSGRYGPYVQLGPNPPAGAKKGNQPKRASVPPGTDSDTITLEDALLWLSLPRLLGDDPATGQPVTAASGRYGPYVQRGDDSRSLGPDEDVYTIELARALALLAEPKSAGFRRRAGARVLGELGPHPDSGAPVRILSGRFGPYASDGATNASIPRGIEPSTVTLDQAVTMLAERAAAPKRPRRSAGARKRAAPKAAKKAP